MIVVQGVSKFVIGGSKVLEKVQMQRHRVLWGERLNK